MEKNEAVSSLGVVKAEPPRTEELQFQEWQKILSLIQKELSERSFDTWFSAVRCLALGAREIVLGVPDDFFGNWLKEHYHGLITSSAEEVLGGRPDVIYRVAPAPAAPSSVSLKIPQTSAAARDLGLNANYTFDNFVIGPGNRFAHAAALAITEAPAKHYNPLFIYGRVGLGKTHLMQAIALETRRRWPDKKILYVSSEKFTNQLISAIQSRSTHTFRACFRNLDLLLVDDIHFVAGKESTQEEFFHTFNTLYDSHKQIVICSDRPPREISSLEERLVSRFGWGLVTDIQPPDLETRVAILRKKLEREAVRVPDDVLFFIAERIKSNIRELEGALIRVVAYASLGGGEVDLAFAEGVLGNSFKEEAKKIGVEEVQQRVAHFFGLSVGDLRAKRRTKQVAHARQVAMFLVREVTNTSLSEIGEYFGGRDHSTVLHACKQIETQEQQNERVRSVLVTLKKQLVF
ncbi:MAG: chromosomal replication initiator protein DnaA [Candidatus Omnitrophica bacterium]|nr:chromosomal replication initiator protein DnaA [Candidatus Omnitrophota bacterium]